MYKHPEFKVLNRAETMALEEDYYGVIGYFPEMESFIYLHKIKHTCPITSTVARLKRIYWNGIEWEDSDIPESFGYFELHEKFLVIDYTGSIYDHVELTQEVLKQLLGV